MKNNKQNIKYEKEFLKLAKIFFYQKYKNNTCKDSFLKYHRLFLCNYLQENITTNYTIYKKNPVDLTILEICKDYIEKEKCKASPYLFGNPFVKSNDITFPYSTLEERFNARLFCILMFPYVIEKKL